MTELINESSINYNPTTKDKGVVKEVSSIAPREPSGAPLTQNLDKTTEPDALTTVLPKTEVSAAPVKESLKTQFSISPLPDLKDTKTKLMLLPEINRAKKGHPLSLFSIGKKFYTGIGMVQDYKLAQCYFLLSLTFISRQVPLDTALRDVAMTYLTIAFFKDKQFEYALFLAKAYFLHPTYPNRLNLLEGNNPPETKEFYDFLKTQEASDSDEIYITEEINSSMWRSEFAKDGRDGLLIEVSYQYSSNLKEMGDKLKSFSEIEDAKKGSSQALFSIGQKFYHGQEVTQDYSLAVYYFLLSLEQISHKDSAGIVLKKTDYDLRNIATVNLAIALFQDNQFEYALYLNESFFSNLNFPLASKLLNESELPGAEEFRQFLLEQPKTTVDWFDIMGELHSTSWKNKFTKEESDHLLIKINSQSSVKPTPPPSSRFWKEPVLTNIQNKTDKAKMGAAVENKEKKRGPGSSR